MTAITQWAKRSYVNRDHATLQRCLRYSTPSINSASWQSRLAQFLDQHLIVVRWNAHSGGEFQRKTGDTFLISGHPHDQAEAMALQEIRLLSVMKCGRSEQPLHTPENCFTRLFRHGVARFIAKAHPKPSLQMFGWANILVRPPLRHHGIVHVRNFCEYYSRVC